MAGVGRENQLELFDVRHQAAPRPRRETLGRFLVSLRHDQAVLAGMAGLIGLTIIFACGVERGKQLARLERSLLIRQPSQPAAQVPSANRAESPVQRAEGATARTVPAAGKAKARPTQAPATAPKPKTATRLAAEAPAAPAAASGASRSRYAIQVVTFSKARLAKEEMDRLRARGERAFLVMRNGRTVVFVGPFPSKSNAAEKLAALRSQYQDCFVKTL
jgi:cell division protein FtsN